MRVLGIDLGGKVSGWGAVSGGQRIASGAWTFGPWRAGVVLPSLIVAKAVELRCDRLAFEAVPFHQSAAAAHEHGELRGCVYTAAALLGLPAPIEVITSVLKKVATGRGNAKKPMVVEAARERWGVIARLEDEAEGLWCAVAGETLATQESQGGLAWP